MVLPDAHAALASTLAAAFEGNVRRIFSAYTVDVTPPGSVLQHVRLVGGDGTVAVLGQVHLGEGWAELRTLGHTLATSRARSGGELRVPPREYARFLEIATGVLSMMGLQVTVTALGTPSRAAASEGTAPETRSGARRLTLPYGTRRLTPASGG